MSMPIINPARLIEFTAEQQKEIKDLTVRNAQEALVQALGLEESPEWAEFRRQAGELPRQMDFAAIFAKIQQFFQKQFEQALEPIRDQIKGLQGQQIMFNYMAGRAMNHYEQQVMLLREELFQLAHRSDELSIMDTMDWEPEHHLTVPVFQIQEEMVQMRKSLQDLPQQIARAQSLPPPLPLGPQQQGYGLPGDSGSPMDETNNDPRYQEARSHPGSEGGNNQPPNQPPRGAAGAPDPDSSDSSDSDSEDERPRKPGPNASHDDIKAYYKAKARRDAKRLADKKLLKHLLRQQREKTPGFHPTSFKAPDPEKFSGKAEDLDRFLRQLEVKFSLEKHRFSEDLTKIKFTSLLLSQEAAKWYESYDLYISPTAREGLPGAPKHFDPLWTTWDHFRKSLKDSFGNRVSREQAVKDWEKLRHTNSIDDFLDALVRLSWRTGYRDTVLEDKIRHSLNHELGKQWAQTYPKPTDVREQMALLRDMGHRLEDYYRSRKVEGSSSKPEGQSSSSGKKPSKKGKERSQKPPGKDKGKGKATSEWKDAKEYLKGIPKDILDQRKKDEKCLRCGKGAHMWYDCHSKTPITSKVAGTKRKREDDSGKVEPEKKAKTAGTALEVRSSAPEASSGAVLTELPDSDDDQVDWEDLLAS